MGESERDREGVGLWEILRELEVLLASVKESEKKEKGKRRVKTVREKEKESCHGAQEPLL